MSAHFLLNLFNKLRKGHKNEVLGLPKHFIAFLHNEFNKFNSTGAQMLDSIIF